MSLVADRTADRFRVWWEELYLIGRAPDGGYHRLAWTTADLEARRWFTTTAKALGLWVEPDGNGNIWAWWERPAGGAVVTGSHLDSVPGGGAFDGPLGVVSALAAVHLLRDRGFEPERPLAVAVFSDEEGGRFGTACVGSRLLTGAGDAGELLSLTDRDGTSCATARADAGLRPATAGPDPERADRLAAFVELHIEQGRGLVDLGAPIGVASAVWPHGRWRLDFTGRGDHAGTTRLADRSDPVLPLAETILATRRAAADHGALGTVGRLDVTPGAVNAVARRATAWLDARASDPTTVRALVADISAAARRAGAEHGVGVTCTEESWAEGAHFDDALRDRVAAAVGRVTAPVPVLATGAGHDAAVLAAVCPTAMLFVRNPTGVSHDPAEHADIEDCLTGVAALAEVLADLCTGPDPADRATRADPTTAAEPVTGGRP